MGRQRWRRGSAVVAVAVALLAAACGSGNAHQGAKGFEISTVAESTEAARTARFEGTYRSRFPGDSEEVAGRIEGDIDFVGRRSAATQTVRQRDGHSSSPQHSVRIGDDLYYETPELRASPGEQDGAGEPAPKPKPWSHFSMAGVDIGSRDEFRMMDVPALLAGLRDEGAEEQLGTETVHDAETTHYRFTGADSDLPAQVLALGMSTDAGETWDLWVDGEQRLRRIDRASHDGLSSSSTEFFDFGAPVEIEAPPASEVGEEGFDSSGITSDWIEVQSGRTDGVSWTVFHAPAPNGSECLSIESDPAKAARVGPTDRGRPVSFCTPQTMGALPDDEWEGDEIQSGAIALRDGHALLVGVAGPKVTHLVLHHRDGRTERVHPSARAFVVVLGHDDVVDRIDPVIPDADVTCKLDESFGDFNCSGSYGPQFPPGVPPDVVPGTTPPTAPPDAVPAS